MNRPILVISSAIAGGEEEEGGCPRWGGRGGADFTRGGPFCSGSISTHSMFVMGLVVAY